MTLILYPRRGRVWTHPSKEETYVLLGTEQGLYTLNLATKDDPTMVILSTKRVTWLSVYDKHNWLLTISGDHTYVYSHNLLLLHENVKDEERQRIASTSFVFTDLHLLMVPNIKSKTYNSPTNSKTLT
eukprot:sb/3475360/